MSKTTRRTPSADRIAKRSATARGNRVNMTALTADVSDDELLVLWAFQVDKRGWNAPVTLTTAALIEQRERRAA